MCAVVVAVLYILLRSHARVQPRCQPPALRDSPATSSVRSFRGYSRVPDGKVRGDGAARPTCASVFLSLGRGGQGLRCIQLLREGRRS